MLPAGVIVFPSDFLVYGCRLECTGRFLYQHSGRQGHFGQPSIFGRNASDRYKRLRKSQEALLNKGAFRKTRSQSDLQKAA
jgi:hypothetical protein